MEEQRLRREFINIYFTTIKHIETEISKPLTQFRLSFEQYQILNDLATHEVATLTDIVAKRQVTKPAIARQLRVLRDLGYVTQASDNGDHRRRLLQLTPLGKRVEAQASALSKANPVKITMNQKSCSTPTHRKLRPIDTKNTGLNTP